MTLFKGTIVPLITPFKKDLEIDEKALADLIEWHIHEKIDAVMLCGTTGEAPTLSEEEKLRIFKIGVEVSAGRVPIIAGTGTYDTRKSLKMTKAAKELGAAGALVVVPYYNRPTPEGCLAHFQEISKAGLPMIVYHHPGRTGTRLSADVLKEISKIPHFAAIKDSSGDLELAKQMGSIPFLSGDDPLTLPMMELGGMGVISIVSNVIPRQWTEMTHAFLEGNKAKAKEINDQYAELCNALVLETNPQPIKYALSFLGKCQPYFRLPLVEPRALTKMQIQSACNSILRPLVQESV